MTQKLPEFDSKMNIKPKEVRSQSLNQWLTLLTYLLPAIFVSPGEFEVSGVEPELIGSIRVLIYSPDKKELNFALIP
jgi:hypothetical protein